MQKLRLDLLKLTGAKHFTAKDGTDHVAVPVAENNIYVGAKGSYLDLTIRDNKDGVDQYGNEGFASVDIPKERREAGEKGPIIGNWKGVGQRANEPRPRQDSHQAQAQQTGGGAGDDDIPF